MITLALLKFLEDNGFGEIDKDLFWQKMGLGNKGLYIVEIGASEDRGSRTSSVYEIYSRGVNDVQGYQILQQVADFLNKSYTVCTLPSVPPITDYQYRNVTIMPVSTISNTGVDSEGRVIYSITGKIYYDKPNLSQRAKN